MTMSDLQELKDWAAKRHRHWCHRLQTIGEVLEMEFTPPKCEFSTRTSKSAGVYFPKERKCRYYLAYIILAGKKYDETIAHEIAHSFVYQTKIRAACHGDLFRFVVHRMCGFGNHKCTHDLSTHKAKKLSKLLRLMEKMNGNGKV